MIERDSEGFECYFGFNTNTTSVLLAGLIPFGMIWLRLHLILKNFWGEHFYYPFGALIWEFCILLIVDAEMAVIFTYVQLCKEVSH